MARDPLKDVRLFIDVLLAVPVVVAGMLALRIPAVPLRDAAIVDRFLGTMLLLAFSTLPLTWWMSGRFVHPSVMHRPEALFRLRLAAFLIAAMAEACALYGLVYYLMTGDRWRAWAFIGLSVAHHLFLRQRLATLRRLA